METFELTAELVDEFTEKLAGVDETKQAIKTAIESKGQDLTDIPFTGYAEKITAIEGGKKFTTGTVTFTTEAGVQTIYHNCGFVPTYFCFKAKEPFEAVQENFGKVISGDFSQAYGYTWASFGGWAVFYSSPFTYRRVTFDLTSGQVTDTKIVLSRAGHNNYRYPANVEYEWIAIE